MVVNLDSHLDADFCREMGEQLLTVDVPKSLLLKSNGSQGNPYRNNQRAMELHRLGLIAARSGLNSGALRTAGRLLEKLEQIALADARSTKTLESSRFQRTYHRYAILKRGNF